MTGDEALAVSVLLEAMSITPAYENLPLTTLATLVKVSLELTDLIDDAATRGEVRLARTRALDMLQSKLESELIEVF